MSDLLIPCGDGHDGILTRVNAAEVGWEYLNMSLLRLGKERLYTSHTGPHEYVCVILGGRCNLLSSRGDFLEVGRRPDVFSGMPYAVYLPRNTEFQIRALTEGLEVAMGWAPTEVDHEARLIRPPDVAVEIRGGGNATRQINSLVPPGFPCQRLVCVEVYTPGGNWSSYPPHKHDVHEVDAQGQLLEADLEEIYFYQMRPRDGFAYQRVYTKKGRDQLLRVEHNDVVLVPEGYHPVVAGHGYDVYYLNFLAGSAQSLANSDDPDHAWIKSTWTDLDPRLPMVHLQMEGSRSMKTRKLTMAQALVEYLSLQVVERDGERSRFFAGMWGIFGHGNVAGLGQALSESGFPFYLSRNEQAQVHAAVAYAKQKQRLACWACTSSVGPGATNMVTGAALATINRLPVLLLPGDIFAQRTQAPVLQQLESEHSQDVSVNDCFRPVSRYWDRLQRPEQLITCLPEAMRVLTSPAETGAVTLCLPQDVQTQSYAYPAAFLEERVWTIPRPRPDKDLVARAAAWIRTSRTPLLIAGGGVHYSQAQQTLHDFVQRTGIPVAETQAGKGSLRYDEPLNLGALGVTGTPGANQLAALADLVIGVGTRYSDFTSASNTAFPKARFINLNVAEFDACKQGALPLVGDARVCLDELLVRLEGWTTSPIHREKASSLNREWDAEVTRVHGLRGGPLLTQGEVIGMVNDFARAQDVVVGAAGSLPGDLHKLWRTRQSGGYHMEYGYSCMGYEIAAGMGVKLADPNREVYVFVGDGSFLMMNTEIATMVAERLKVVIIVLNNHGFASIGGLSKSVGNDGFGTKYRFRGESGQLDGHPVPVDYAQNCLSLGAHVISANTRARFQEGLKEARQVEGRPVCLVAAVDRRSRVGGSESWWDVPVAEVSSQTSVQEARAEYERTSKERRSRR